MVRGRTVSFREFTFPQVLEDLGLTLRDVDLYSRVAPIAVRPEFAALLSEWRQLAVDIHTEKARSEFLIAPVLAELRHILEQQISLFSGVELNADPSRGLNGVCDFIISRSSMQLFVTAPIVAIAEAKPDLPRTGFGPCIAAMMAARVFNESRKQPATVVYGASTSGTAWQFLRLEDKILTIDRHEYYIDNLGKIMGILKTMVTAP